MTDMKFKENVIRFMGGRYGSDQLGNAALILCTALIIVNVFVRSVILYALIMAVMGWSIYRTMSRKIYDRRRENEWFLGIVGKARSFFNLQKRKFTDRKTHVYRTCPNCRKTLRLPKQKGSHTVCCPCCRKDFSCVIR